MTPIWNSVIEDMRKRDEVGREKYGKPLLAFDGRDTLQDAYEEALDMAVYLKKAIMERDTHPDMKDNIIRSLVERCAGQAEVIGRNANKIIRCPECQGRGNLSEVTTVYKACHHCKGTGLVNKG